MVAATREGKVEQLSMFLDQGTYKSVRAMNNLQANLRSKGGNAESDRQTKINFVYFLLATALYRGVQNVLQPELRRHLVSRDNLASKCSIDVCLCRCFAELQIVGWEHSSSCSNRGGP
jgi:hypothetical protein